jgi:hypothetical protein
MIGVALSDHIIASQSNTHSMIRNHFNSVVAENCMKRVGFNGAGMKVKGKKKSHQRQDLFRMQYI